MQGVRPSSQNASQFDPRPKTGGFLKIKSFAKLNLFLDVVSKRDDGYHNIASVMQSVDLCDELFFSVPGAKKNVPHNFEPEKKEEALKDVSHLFKPENKELAMKEVSHSEFNVNGTVFSFATDSNEVPIDDSNLIVRAAKVMVSEYGIKNPFEIRLKKHIPVGAGLGGGSSNCAAVLHGINTLFDLKVPQNELTDIGITLGADVPFCLTGGTCLAEGIGEKLTPLAPHPDCFILIAHPNIHVSTKEIFDSLEASDFYGGKSKLSQIFDGLSNNELTKVALSLYNVFTDLTTKKVPQVGSMLAVLKSGGALAASMTGTGSAVFGYFTDIENAQVNAEELKKIGRVFVTRPLR